MRLMTFAGARSRGVAIASPDYFFFSSSFSAHVLRNFFVGNISETFVLPADFIWVSEGDAKKSLAAVERVED